MRCSSCGSNNPDGKRFCADCGSELNEPCPKCGSENPIGKKFCGDCGAALVVNAQPDELRPHRVASAGFRITPERTDASTAAEATPTPG